VEEIFALGIAMSSSRNALSVRWDAKGQTFRLLLPRVTAIKGCNHDLGNRLNQGHVMAFDPDRRILINGYDWRGASFRDAGLKFQLQASRSLFKAFHFSLKTGLYPFWLLFWVCFVPISTVFPFIPFVPFVVAKIGCGLGALSLFWELGTMMYELCLNFWEKL
ncbi:hypothetical protein L195_g046652, partial [Trifolium pratense]